MFGSEERGGATIVRRCRVDIALTAEDNHSSQMRGRAAWLAAVASLAIAAALLPLSPRFDALLFDQQVHLLRLWRADQALPLVPDVVVVGIDDASLAATGEPLPASLIHAELGRALQAIAAAAPRLTVVDIGLPLASVETLRPGHDRALVTGLVLAREAGGVVVALTHDAAGRLTPPHESFIAAAGADSLGLPLYPVEVDNVVRRFDPNIAGADAATLPTLLARIAARLKIPERTAHAGWIDFTRGAAFDYVPLAAVNVWSRESRDADLARNFAGKVVLIGIVVPYQDRHVLPIALAAWERDAAGTPGVVLHAQAVRSIVGGGLIRAMPAWAPWVLAILFVLLTAVPSAIWRWPTLAALLAAGFAASAALHANGWWLPVSSALVAATLAVIIRTALDVVLARRERARLTQTFGGYVSPQLLRAILSGRVTTAGGRRAMAFMFADLRGFTAWSERTEPEEVLAVLNRYYSTVTPIVHRHGGTIDNFRGDGIMVMFGAPEVHARPCDAAFTTAREIVIALAQLNSDELDARGAALEVSIGVAWGEAVFGDLGSDDRKDFTALGDAVNVAARLQDLAKSLGFPVLLTIAAVEQLDPFARVTYELELLGEAPLKNHSPVAIAGWRHGSTNAVAAPGAAVVNIAQPRVGFSRHGAARLA